MSGSESRRRLETIQADRGGIAAGRDVNIEGGISQAGRDFHQYNGVISEHEPEWSNPPRDSGLILCPRCKRRHIADEAVACHRCGYPHREIEQARIQYWQREARLAQAIKNLCGTSCLVAGMVLGFIQRLDVPRQLAVAVLCGAIGYFFLPSAYEGVARWINKLFGNSRD